MKNVKKQLQGGVAAAIIIASMLVGGAIAFAQNETSEAERAVGAATSGITFPIAELGGCTDKAACHAYCELGEHMDACVAFAESHGLMTKSEAERSTKFATKIKGGGGPGGCTSPGACRAYCEDIAHLDACIAFAGTQGFKGPEYEQGKKIASYVKGGGKMPGGCTSRMSCQTYCSDFSHAEECSAFAAKAGVMEDGDRGEHDPTPAQLKQLGELAAKGETPGGCTTKDACMTYCQDFAHHEECLAFGERLGFIKKGDAERIRQFAGEQGFKGPGGCDSEASCHAFCNEASNREICFAFAEKNGLIPKEQMEEMKEGLVRLRQGLENAPEEVRECLTSTLGVDAIADIQSGKFVPGPAIGEQMRGCFEKFGGNHDPSKELQKAPPEVTACLKEKLGDQFADLRSGKTKPTPEIADQFRVCFQQMQISRGDWGGPQDEESDRPMQGGKQGMPSLEQIKATFRSVPPEVAACLKEKLGGDFEKIQTGIMLPTPDLGSKMQACFSSFRPMMEGAGSGTMTRPVMGVPMQEGTVGSGQFLERFPPEVATCVKEKLGEGVLEKLGQTRPTPAQEEQIRSCLMLIKSEGGLMPRVPASSVMPMPPVEQGGETPSALPVGWVSRLPLAVQACLQEKYGAEKLGAIGRMPPTPEIEQVMKTCFAAGGGVPGTSGSMTPPPPLSPPTGSMLPPTMERVPAPQVPMMPPLPMETAAPQSRSFAQSLLGAVAAPFVRLWEAL